METVHPKKNGCHVEGNTVTRPPMSAVHVPRGFLPLRSGGPHRHPQATAPGFGMTGLPTNCPTTGAQMFQLV